MISYRGILALVIGILFAAVGLNANVFFDQPPPIIIRLIIVFVGALTLFAGVRLIQTVRRRAKMIKEDTPVPAQVIVFPETDAESGARTLHLKFDNACWALAMDLSGTPGPDLDDGMTRDGKVWIDRTNNQPVAVSVAGNQLNLILGMEQIKETEFGRV